MQRVATILCLTLVSTPAFASDCAPFTIGAYETLSSKVFSPDVDLPPQIIKLGLDDAKFLLDCNGEEVGNNGVVRDVIYRSPLGGMLMIRWQGDRMVGISQSGLKSDP